MTKKLKLANWLIVLFVAMIFLALINLNTGQMSISPDKIWGLLMGKGS
jgi:hypothetical protein